MQASPVFAIALATAGALVSLVSSAAHAAPPASKDVTSTYADIAHAGYEDALTTARELRDAVAALLQAPGEKTLARARRQWKAARVPYQQTEVYRFGNTAVDEWEGKVNAWPLDEGLIDYVAEGYGAQSDENAFYTVNIIANPELTVAGRTIRADPIDADLLRSMHEVDAVEANVATGYHAIEFLLWGQDLNGTGPGAGTRPWTDYVTGDACTGGHCDRRRAYLLAATELLVRDLEDIVAAWGADGDARQHLMAASPEQGLVAILTGMGSLSYGELAGERMRLGLMLHDPEEEHDCFSDNTHNSHYYDALGIRNVYLGHYRRVGGDVVSGPGLSELVRAAAPGIDDELRARLDATMAAMQRMQERAEQGGMAYDQMLAEGNSEGHAIIQAAIDALVSQTRSIERAAAALGLDALTIEGSDSLDDPKAVFR